MATTIIGWLISLLVGVVAVMLYLAFAGEEKASVESSLQGAAKKRQWPGALLKVVGPLIERLGEIMALLPLEKKRAELNKRLIQAGRPGGLNADEFNATRILAIVCGLLAGSYFDVELGSSPIGLILLAVLGFIYPDIWLNGLTRKRKRRIFRDFPDTLDTLRLSMDAGLDFGSAMKVVVERGRKGPLNSELELVERDMSLGKTRSESLRTFSNRLQMVEINAFVLALIQADQLGASIAPILRIQSEMARKRRWTYAEEVVNKLPMKMLAPLVALIFPASFIILFTPLVIQYMQGGV